MAEGLCQLFVLLDPADEVHTHVGRALEPFGLTRATFQALWHLSSDGAQTHKAMANRAGCAGPCVANGGFTAGIGFGTPFIANPDLPERFRVGADLVDSNRDTFYGGAEQGYTDYPSL